MENLNFAFAFNLSSFYSSHHPHQNAERTRATIFRCAPLRPRPQRDELLATRFEGVPAWTRARREGRSRTRKGKIHETAQVSWTSMAYSDLSTDFTA